MSFDCIYPLPTPPFLSSWIYLPCPSSIMLSFLTFFFFSRASKSSICFIYTWIQGHPLECGWLTVPQKPSVVNSSSGRGGGSWAPLPCTLECWLAWSCMSTHSCWEVLSAGVLPCSEGSTSFRSSLTSGFNSLFCPFFCHGLLYRGRVIWMSNVWLST